MIMIKRLLASLALASLILFSLPVSARALTASPENLAGASTANDFQPTTGNPQNNVGSVSQGQTGQNNLQTPQVVEQTALPNVVDLRVIGVTGDVNSNTTKTEVTTDNKPLINTWLIIAIGVFVAAAAVYAVSWQRQKKPAKSASTDDIAQPTKQQAVKSQPAITTNKNIKRKKGKSSKKAKRKR